MQMDPERWSRLEDLYHCALKLDPVGRVQFLDEMCSDDPQLKREVESLLAYDESANSFIEKPAIQVAGAQFASQLMESGSMNGVDAIIGPYHLLELIGEGGMGEVWLADQSSPIRRRVALKLIRLGMDSREVTARFQSERQALALMDHPAVAKVFDGGSTSSGRPYFVMEFVPGTPITEWCDTHNLGISERLELFIQVCEGVKHAHQRAIIHRDLKPSNILVTEVDGKPAPKIIDFGVAKAVSQKLSENTFLTSAGVILGTPEYMSPEQAASAGEDVDTRTDVYSLGVLLYELLVGVTPADLARLSFEDMLRKLREYDPPKPSTKLRSLGDKSSAVCAHRLTAPGTMARILQGDLDSITMKALEKRRERRYGSPSELADDIGRYLRHEPVLARPQSSWYRTTRLVRRHRWAFGAAAGVTLALTVGLSAALWQAHLARTQAQVANREAQTSAEVQQFITEIFETNTLSQPDPQKARQTTARQLLDIGLNKINGGMQNAPEAKEKMLGILSQLYLGLGLEDEAVALDRKKVALAKSLYGPLDTRVAAALCDLGESMEGSHSSDERESVLLQAKGILDRNRDFSSATRGQLLLGLSEYYWSSNQQKSLDFANQAVAFFRNRPISEELAQALYDQGFALGLSKEYARAIVSLDECVSIARNVGLKSNTVLSKFEALLADLNLRLMRYDAAKTNFELAFNTARAIYGDDHEVSIQAEAALAQFYGQTAQFTSATAHLRNALANSLKVKGADDPVTTPEMYLLYGVALAHSGQFEAALPALSQALDTFEKVSPGSRKVGESLWWRASVLADLGQYENAKADLNDATAIGEKTHSKLQQFNCERVRLDMAFDLHNPAEAAAIIQKIYGEVPDHAPLSLDLLRNLAARAQLALAENDPVVALQFAKRLSDAVTRDPNRKYLKVWEANAALSAGMAHLALGHPQEALPPLQQAAALAADIYDPASAELIPPRATLALASLQAGNRTESSRLLQQLEAIQKLHPHLGERFDAPLRELRQASHRTKGTTS